MSRSILNHQVFRGDVVNAVVIAIHGFAEDHTDALRMVLGMSEELLVYAPGSARPVSPRFSATEPTKRAKLWYFEQKGVIEPTLFGDSLRQLEALLFDITEHALPELPEDIPVYILGRGQGGTLSLALASLWPELVDGVISVDGPIPKVPGWEVPSSDLTDRKFALVHTSGGAISSELQTETRTSLEERGAAVSSRHCDAAALKEVLREQYDWLTT